MFLVISTPTNENLLYRGLVISVGVPCGLDLIVTRRMNMRTMIHCKGKIKTNTRLVIMGSKPVKLAYVNGGDDISFGPQDYDSAARLAEYKTLRGAVTCRISRRQYIVEIPRQLVAFTNERISSNV